MHQSFNVEGRHGKDVDAKESRGGNKHEEVPVIALHQQKEEALGSSIWNLQQKKNANRTAK